MSEAMSQALINYSAQSFPSFNDVLTDANQGVGSLLSVRGQIILSWIEDDNFVVEDKATGRQENTAEVQASQEQKSRNSEVMLNSEAANKASSELSDGAKKIDKYIDVTETTTMTHPVIGEQWKSRAISKGLSIDQVNVSFDAVQNSEPSRIEAADAEAELDMLLKSFRDSKISKSPVVREDLSYKTDASPSGSKGVSSDGFVPVTINQGPNVSKSTLSI